MPVEPQYVYGFYRDGLLDQVQYFPMWNYPVEQRASKKAGCTAIAAKMARGRTVVELDANALPELGSTLNA